MTFEEFKKFALDVCGKYSVYAVYHEDEDCNWKKDRDVLFKDIIKSEKWVTGGQGGGSCWDDGNEDHHYYRSAQDEDNFDSLFKLMEAICPQMSFIDYKYILDTLVETHDEYENEYYGNYTEYRFKFIRLQKLYQHLRAKEII